MTAIAQGHNGVSNGNGHHADGEAQQHSVVASTAFSHLTLYTGNTMRTGTTGQLNTTLRKSNLEVRLYSKEKETLKARVLINDTNFIIVWWRSSSLIVA